MQYLLFVLYYCLWWITWKKSLLKYNFKKDFLIWWCTLNSVWVCQCVWGKGKGCGDETKKWVAAKWYCGHWYSDRLPFGQLKCLVVCVRAHACGVCVCVYSNKLIYTFGGRWDWTGPQFLHFLFLIWHVILLWVVTAMIQFRIQIHLATR